MIIYFFAILENLTNGVINHPHFQGSIICITLIARLYNVPSVLTPLIILLITLCWKVYGLLDFHFYETLLVLCCSDYVLVAFLFSQDWLTSLFSGWLSIIYAIKYTLKRFFRRIILFQSFYPGVFVNYGVMNLFINKFPELFCPGKNELFIFTNFLLHWPRMYRKYSRNFFSLNTIISNLWIICILGLL